MLGLCDRSSNDAELFFRSGIPLNAGLFLPEAAYFRKGRASEQSI